MHGMWPCTNVFIIIETPASSNVHVWLSATGASINARKLSPPNTLLRRRVLFANHLL